MNHSSKLNNCDVSAEILNAHDLRIFYLLKRISLHKYRNIHENLNKIKNKSPKMLTSDKLISSCPENCTLR